MRIKRLFKNIFDKTMERELDNFIEAINNLNLDVEKLTTENAALKERVENLEKKNGD